LEVNSSVIEEVNSSVFGGKFFRNTPFKYPILWALKRSENNENAFPCRKRRKTLSKKKSI
jgi:hypothetical protein